MKPPVHPFSSRLLVQPYLPAFCWVQQDPTPVWGAAQPGGAAPWVQAVGTATDASGSKFLGWSPTGTVRMGCVSTTVGGDSCIAVHTVP